MSNPQNKFIYKFIYMHSDNSSALFMMLKSQFPHLDLQIINPEVSFAENLQNIVEQIQLPNCMKANDEIIHMKDAVDQQQLKIQKNLVNEESVLNNITNQPQTNSQNEKKVKEEEFDWPQPPRDDDIFDDIWEFGPSINQKDWFNR